MTTTFSDLTTTHTNPTGEALVAVEQGGSIGRTKLSDLNKNQSGVKSVDYSYQNLTPSNGAITLDVGQYSYFNVDLNQNINSINFTGVSTTNVSEANIDFNQDATGGHTVTWPSTVPSNPTVDATAGNSTLVSLVHFSNKTNWSVKGSASSGASGGASNQAPVDSTTVAKPADWIGYSKVDI
jgi:hypothetical protein